MKVAITAIIDSKQSIFSNGICQNVLFMQNLFEQCANVENCYIVNMKDTPKEDFVGTTWEKYIDKFIPMSDIENLCDVLVICHGFMAKADCDKYRKKGIKIVKHVLGASHSMFNERIVFQDAVAGTYPRIDFDAVWISPHFYERDRFFHETIHSCPVYSANYIWEPRFTEMSAKEHGLEGYKPSGNIAKRIITSEPNINIVKTCVVPVTIAERTQRKYPDLLKYFLVFCGDKIKDKKDMIEFVANLDVHAKGKCVFQPRYPLAAILKLHTDIVLCHQNQCELNYLYLDAAWMGYPVVHNSPLMKELGWYYPDNDAEIATQHIKYIAENFDTKEHPNQRYMMRSREFANKYRINNNIHAYESLLEKLFSA